APGARPARARPRARARLPVRRRPVDDAGVGDPLPEQHVLRSCIADGAVRLRRLGGDGQVPAARRGDRMTTALAAEIVVAALLLASGALVLTAALGLLRLAHFFQLLHAPSLPNTLAAWCVSLASIVHFSVLEERLSLHVLV